MKISIETPRKSTILKKGIDVSLAPQGATWSELDLGECRKEKGVYVIHHDNKIKYVGKTNGPTMSFGVRLRRHFQEKAAGKHTYPRLEALDKRKSIRVSLFSLDQIEGYVEGRIPASTKLEVIPLFESALIISLKPEFQTENGKLSV